MSDIKKIEFGKVVNKIVDVWLFEYDGEVDLSNATTDEVAQVAWMSRCKYVWGDVGILFYGSGQREVLNV